MDIVSWIKTTLSKYNANNTHNKNAIYFVKNEDGKTGKIISDEIVYGNGDVVTEDAMFAAIEQAITTTLNTEV